MPAQRHHQAAAPVVHVLYRYTESLGSKPRPEYFSKMLALQSFVRAMRRARGRVAVTFLVDGVVSGEVDAVMQAAGEVRRGHWASNRASYAEQLRVARGMSAQLVWFAEDDYLYSPDSLTALVSVVQDLPRVPWFALSGPTPLHRLELRRAQSAVNLPRSSTWRSSTDWHDRGGRPWRRIDSTTSTFGGRPAAIRQAYWLLHLCPWSGAAWDRTTCLAIQGATPYPWRYVLSDLLPASTPRRHRALRVGWRVLTRVVTNLAALSQRHRRRVLVAPAVPLVGHMDLPYESEPERWNALAASLRRSDRHLASCPTPGANLPSR